VAKVQAADVPDTDDALRVHKPAERALIPEQAPPIAGAPSAAAAPAVDIEPARLAEAPSTSTTLPSPEVVLPQVVRSVETLTRSGQTAMHVQLHPEALGRIDLQLTSGPDGLRVTLTAELAPTGDLLQRHIADLRQTLAGTGLDISALSVGVGQGQSQAGQGFAWGRPANTAHGASMVAATEPASQPSTTDVIWIGNGAARIDYRV
jgi:flagellar hook-length control protein FliK